MPFRSLYSLTEKRKRDRFGNPNVTTQGTFGYIGRGLEARARKTAAEDTRYMSFLKDRGRNVKKFGDDAESREAFRTEMDTKLARQKAMEEDAWAIEQTAKSWERENLEEKARRKQISDMTGTASVMRRGSVPGGDFTAPDPRTPSILEMEDLLDPKRKKRKGGPFAQTLLGG